MATVGIGYNSGRQPSAGTKAVGSYYRVKWLASGIWLASTAGALSAVGWYHLLPAPNQRALHNHYLCQTSPCWYAATGKRPSGSAYALRASRSALRVRAPWPLCRPGQCPCSCPLLLLGECAWLWVLAEAGALGDWLRCSGFRSVKQTQRVMSSAEAYRLEGRDLPQNCALGALLRQPATNMFVPEALSAAQLIAHLQHTSYQQVYHKPGTSDSHTLAPTPTTNYSSVTKLWLVESHDRPGATAREEFRETLSKPG